MVEQVDEERYIVFADALFIERHDEAPAGGFEEEVAVFDAFGNALARYDGADVVTRDQCGQVVGLDVRINRHQAASTPPGSLKIISSSAVTTTPSTTGRRPATATPSQRPTRYTQPAPALGPTAAILCRHAGP